jgi:hypothetical protein
MHGKMNDQQNAHYFKSALEQLASLVDAADVEQGDEASGELDRNEMYCTTDKWGNG